MVSARMAAPVAQRPVLAGRADQDRNTRFWNGIPTVPTNRHTSLSAEVWFFLCPPGARTREEAALVDLAALVEEEKLHAGTIRRSPQEGQLPCRSHHRGLRHRQAAGGVGSRTGQIPGTRRPAAHGRRTHPDRRRSLVRNWAPQRRLDRPCPPPAPGGAAPGCSSDQGRCELVARSSIRASCRRDTGCAHRRGICGPARHPARIRREHRSPRQWSERRLHDRDEKPAVPKDRSPKGEEAGGDAPRRARRRLGDARDLPRPAPRPRSLPLARVSGSSAERACSPGSRFSAIGYSSPIVSQPSRTGSRPGSAAPRSPAARAASLPRPARRPRACRRSSCRTRPCRNGHGPRG